MVGARVLLVGDKLSRLDEAGAFVGEAHEQPRRAITIHDNRCLICSRFWGAVMDLRGFA